MSGRVFHHARGCAILLGEVFVVPCLSRRGLIRLVAGVKLLAHRGIVLVAQNDLIENAAVRIERRLDEAHVGHIALLVTVLHVVIPERIAADNVVGISRGVFMVRVDPESSPREQQDAGVRYALLIEFAAVRHLGDLGNMPFQVGEHISRSGVAIRRLAIAVERRHLAQVDGSQARAGEQTAAAAGVIVSTPVIAVDRFRRRAFHACAPCLLGNVFKADKRFKRAALSEHTRETVKLDVVPREPADVERLQRCAAEENRTERRRLRRIQARKVDAFARRAATEGAVKRGDLRRVQSRKVEAFNGAVVLPEAVHTVDSDFLVGRSDNNVAELAFDGSECIPGFLRIHPRCVKARVFARNGQIVNRLALGIRLARFGQFPVGVRAEIALLEHASCLEKVCVLRRR